MSSADAKEKNIDTVLKTKMPALGIDLGGTNIRSAVVSDLKVIGEMRTRPTPKGKEHILDALVEVIQEFQKEHVLAGVGIATAGVVNCDTGEVIGSTGNLPGWAGTPVKRTIESKTLLPVHVDNDANAAGYGEARVLGGSKRCVVAITVGTGIGGGIVIDGDLYRGAHWAAAECGHIRIALHNQRLCTCGLFDCWEAYGSGRGFRATAKEILLSVTKEQSKLAGTLDPTVEMVIEAAAEDDMVAKRIIDLWHEHLTAGMTTLAHTLDPDCFVVSGGMSKFIDYELLKELVRDKVMPTIGEKIDIHRSSLGTAAGLVGAAQLVLDTIIAGKQV